MLLDAQSLPTAALLLTRGHCLQESSAIDAGPPGKHVLAITVQCAGDWHCHDCRAAKKAAAKVPRPATSTEAVLSEPEAEPKTTAKPARRSALAPSALQTEKPRDHDLSVVCTQCHAECFQMVTQWQTCG